MSDVAAQQSRRVGLSGLFGRLTRRVAPTQTLGVAGTSIFSGYIQTLERDPALTGRERYRTFSDNLANCTIIGAGTRFFQNLVSKASWSVEAADDSPQAEDIAERIDAMRGDMTTPWHRVVRRAAMYKFYGFSIQEWTAKRLDDGTIGMADVAPRPQITVERWDVEADGTVQGVVQRSPQSQQEIFLPRQKLVYMVDDTLSDSPEGLGLFRHMATTAIDLKRFEVLEGMGFDRDLRGIPVGRVPKAALAQAVQDGTLTKAQADAAIKAMEDFVQIQAKKPITGIVLDSQPYVTIDERASPSTTRQWDIDLLQGGNTTQDQVDVSIRRKTVEIARLMAVQNLIIGTDGAGSLALSRDASHNFALVVDSTLTEIAETLQDDWVKPIGMLNGWPEELLPRLVPEKTQFRDIEQLAQAIRDFEMAGLPPDDPARDTFRDLLGFPRANVDEDLMDVSLLGNQNADELPDRREQEEEA